MTERLHIIRTDGFDRDYIDDTLIAENVMKFYAEKIVKLLNLNERDHAYFYKAVPLDYKLHKFKP